MHFSRVDVVLLSILLLVGGFLRFFMIHEIPCGLFPDQAIHGLDALRFSQGLISPVYGTNEGLFVYLVALSHFLFGTGIWQIFIVSAFLGTLTIGTTYLAVKELSNTTVAFLTSFFLAVSSWHLALSRSGFRAILVPLILSLFAFFLVKALKRREPKEKQTYAFFTGLVFGLGFYTYNAYWAFPIGLFFLLAFFFLKQGKKLFVLFKENKKPILTGFITFAIVMIPLALYIIFFPEKYFGRANEVSIFSQTRSFSEAGRFIFINFWETFQGLFRGGDLNWRHNPAGTPLLSPLLAVFFWFGIIFFPIVQRGKYLILVFLFFSMFIPAVMTRDGLPPHGLRLIGIIPLLFFFPALFLAWIVNQKHKIFKWIRPIILAVVLFFTAFGGYRAYFDSVPRAKGYYWSFRCDLTRVAEFLNSQKTDEIELIADEFSYQTLRYLWYPKKRPYIKPEIFIENFKTNANMKEKIWLLTNSYTDTDRHIQNLLKDGYRKEVMMNHFSEPDYFVFYPAQ